MDALINPMRKLVAAGFSPLPLANALGQFDQLALARVTAPVVDVAQLRAGFPGIATRFGLPRRIEPYRPWPVQRSIIHLEPADALTELLRWPAASSHDWFGDGP